MRSPLRSPAQVEGSQGFLPQPEKGLERHSSTRLEARFPYHGSGIAKGDAIMRGDLPRSKRLLISWLQSPSAVILEPKKIKSATISTVSPSICHEVMGLDATILVF